MDKKQIENDVIAIIADSLGRDASTITCDSDIANDLGADSLDLAELTMSLEEKFGTDIGDEDVSNITTVGHVVDLIAKQLVDQQD